MKKPLLKLALIFVVLFVFCAIWQSDSKETDADRAGQVQASSSVVEAEYPAETPAAPNWTYTKQPDKMNGTVVRWACTTSKGTGAQLCFREARGHLVSYLSLPSTGGQFFCLEDHCSTQIKIDDHAASTEEGEEADAGDTRTMFLPSAPSLLKRVQSANEILIRAPMFEVGSGDFDFNVSGLRWQ